MDVWPVRVRAGISIVFILSEIAHILGTEYELGQILHCVTKKFAQETLKQFKSLHSLFIIDSFISCSRNTTKSQALDQKILENSRTQYLSLSVLPGQEEKTFWSPIWKTPDKYWNDLTKTNSCLYPVFILAKNNFFIFIFFLHSFFWRDNFWRHFVNFIRNCWI